MTGEERGERKHEGKGEGVNARPRVQSDAEVLGYGKGVMHRSRGWMWWMIRG